jgi:hypothetical protein
MIKKPPFRVTPELALWAYAKTQYLAVMGAYVDGPEVMHDVFTCGCPAGVLAVASGVGPEAPAVCTWLERKAGKAYESAFTASFDAGGRPCPLYHERALDRERDRQGAEDGRAVRKAVEAAGLFRAQYLPWLGRKTTKAAWLEEHCPAGWNP